MAPKAAEHRIVDLIRIALSPLFYFDSLTPTIYRILSVIRSQAACDRAAFAAARTRVTPSATLVFLNSNDFPRCHRKAGPGPQEPHPPRRRARGLDSVAAEQAIERQPQIGRASCRERGCQYV